MNDSRVVSAIDVLERIADGLALPDQAKQSKPEEQPLHHW
jgi:hypothetical protein